MISLSKNQGISLSKACEQSGIKALTNINVGIGWKHSSTDKDLDLDAWVACVDNGEMNARADSIVYFGHKTNYSGKVKHLGDNLHGGDGESDNETVNIKLSELPKKCSHLIVGVTIYGARFRGQTFASIEKAFARIYDTATGIDIIKYTDSITDKLGSFSTILLGAFVKDKNTGEWEFIALGTGLDIDSVNGAIAPKINMIVNNLDKETSSVNTESNKFNGSTNINSCATERKKVMAVSLSKGGKVSLAKVAADAGIEHLSKLSVGLGWDTNRYDGGAQFDLDASAFCCGANGKVTSDSDFIFYNNKVMPGIEHMGDNRTGEGEGDDETINIDLDAIPENITEINITVTIDQCDVRNQNFGMVENSYVRVVDQVTGTELIRYDLGEDFSTETAIVVAKIYKHNGEWKFNAIGSGFSGGLAALCANFGINVG